MQERKKGFTNINKNNKQIMKGDDEICTQMDL